MVPIIGSNGDTLSCRFKEVWPPPQIGVFGNTAEECREEVEESVYLKLRTWESVCGITAMEEKKCLSCPNLELNGKGALVGTGAKLFQDNMGRYRASKKR